MHWKFVDETVEDMATGMLHRPGCREIDPWATVDVHLAGSSVERDVAPRECWACQPEMFLVLGV